MAASGDASTNEGGVAQGSAAYTRKAIGEVGAVGKPGTPSGPHAGAGSDALCVTCMMAAAKKPEKDEGSSAVNVAFINLGAASLWPVFAGLLIFFFRKRVAEFLTRFGERLADPKQNVTAFGVAVGPAQGQVETLSASVAQLSQLVKSTNTTPPTDTHIELQSLGEQYEVVRGTTAKETGLLKSDLGKKMGTLVLMAGAERQELAKQLLTSNVEANITAVAFGVLADPGLVDARQLYAAARTLKRSHPRYAVALALDRLAQAGLLASPRDALAAVDAMEPGADPHLAKRLAATRASIMIWSV
jgi:hypothetical protein